MAVRRPESFLDGNRTVAMPARHGRCGLLSRYNNNRQRRSNASPSLLRAHRADQMRAVRPAKSSLVAAALATRSNNNQLQTITSAKLHDSNHKIALSNRNPRSHQSYDESHREADIIFIHLFNFLQNLFDISYLCRAKQCARARARA